MINHSWSWIIMKHQLHLLVGVIFFSGVQTTNQLSIDPWLYILFVEVILRVQIPETYLPERATARLAGSLWRIRFGHWDSLFLALTAVVRRSLAAPSWLLFLLLLSLRVGWGSRLGINHKDYWLLLVWNHSKGPRSIPLEFIVVHGSWSNTFSIWEAVDFSLLHARKTSCIPTQQCVSCDARRSKIVDDALRHAVWPEKRLMIGWNGRWDGATRRRGPRLFIDHGAGCALGSRVSYIQVNRG